MNKPNGSILNINTALLGLVVALSAWTINRVSALSEQMSAGNERFSGQARELVEIRARLTLCEAQGQANALAIARMTAVGPR